MTNAERQQRYRDRNAARNVTPEPVTDGVTPSVTVCPNCQVLADEVAQLKRELAESNARTVPWRPLVVAKAPRSAQRDAPQGIEVCGGPGRCRKLVCAHGGAA